MDTGENRDGIYEGDMEVDRSTYEVDMEVDPPICLPSDIADQKHSREWNLNTTGMQHSSGISDTAALGMQQPYAVSNAMQGVYHEDLP